MRPASPRRFLLILAVPVLAAAAEPYPSYRVGDTVEAWPDRDKSRLELCTIKEVLPKHTYRMTCGYPNTELIMGADFIWRLHQKPTAAEPAPEPPRDDAR